ncbi:hypothetical protein [Butyrivibrio sp. VCB2006]|uniref:hypothetical protein n=1 Tax=Butyrivibrio sp. VCB2006 TaxID=1280679 RepID=UPI00041B89B2|nr:hypothetical protein [Butyrivibrio sp. VCB2006]
MKLLRTYFSKDRFMEDLFCILALIMLVPLFYLCLTKIGTNPDPSIEYITISDTPWQKNLLKLALALGVIIVIGLFYDSFLYRIPDRILLTISCVIVTVIAITWVVLTKTSPEADQQAAYIYATMYLEGDRSMLAQGGYMSLNSQNLGLMYVWMILIRLFGEEPYLQFKIIVAAMLPALVISGYHITGFLSEHSRKAQFFYLLFMVTNFPIYGYTPFLYGDLISTILIMCSLWCFMSLLHKPRVYKALLLFLLCALAVFMRMNAVIMLVAYLVVIVGLFIRSILKKKNHKHTYLSFILATIAIICSILASKIAINKLFDIPEDAPATPALAYIYMGNYDWDYPGWWNGSHVQIFSSNNYDVKATNKAAVKELQEVFEHCKEDPEFFKSFYGYKLIAQWETPMYQCLPMSRLYNKGSFSWVSDIYNRQGIGLLIEKYMKLYQLLLYFSLLVLILIRLFKKQFDLIWYTPLIGVFGGFLFSLIWEAKGRYVFPYFVYAIPYMACVCGSIFRYQKNRVG